MNEFSKASLARLDKVHPDLSRLMLTARQQVTRFNGFTFEITKGMRTLAEQKELLALKATKTLNSRHLTGHAVDVVVKIRNTVKWDWPLYVRLAEELILPLSKEMDIPVTWGGVWPTLRDGPHYELTWERYPLKK